MARILCNVAGGGKPLKGNAETGDVLAGKTFSNKQSNALTGSMPNNGTNKNAVSVGGGSGGLWAYMPYGYYDNYNNSGNAWINITDDQAKTLANNAGVGYNQGVSDADGRVNTSSASYNSGYTKGYNSGMQVRTGLLVILNGNSGTASDTLAPGTYDWRVDSKVEWWIAYKVVADGAVYANVADYKGDAETHTGGTFTINHKFNASVYGHAYGYGALCVSINRR